MGIKNLIEISDILTSSSGYLGKYGKKGKNTAAAGPNPFSRRARAFHRLNPFLVTESKMRNLESIERSVYF
jgi:hypothetical protein